MNKITKPKFLSFFVIFLDAWIFLQSNFRVMFMIAKDLVTSNVSHDYRVNASIDAWKEYTAFNCIIHTKCQCQHQHQCQNSNEDRFKTINASISIAALCEHGLRFRNYCGLACIVNTPPTKTSDVCYNLRETCNYSNSQFKLKVRHGNLPFMIKSTFWTSRWCTYVWSMPNYIAGYHSCLNVVFT